MQDGCSSRIGPEQLASCSDVAQLVLTCAGSSSCKAQRQRGQQELAPLALGVAGLEPADLGYSAAAE